MNEGTVLIQVESQVTSRFRYVIIYWQTIILKTTADFFRLNEETYTAFVEFTRRNCGVDFLKAFGAGKIDVQILGRF